VRHEQPAGKALGYAVSNIAGRSLGALSRLRLKRAEKEQKQDRHRVNAFTHIRSLSTERAPWRLHENAVEGDRVWVEQRRKSDHSLASGKPDFNRAIGFRDHRREAFLDEKHMLDRLVGFLKRLAVFPFNSG
jgi:hypothetical protein